MTESSGAIMRSVFAFFGIGFCARAGWTRQYVPHNQGRGDNQDQRLKDRRDADSVGDAACAPQKQIIFREDAP